MVSASFSCIFVGPKGLKYMYMYMYTHVNLGSLPWRLDNHLA